VRVRAREPARQRDEEPLQLLLAERDARGAQVADELADDLQDEILRLHVLEVEPLVGEQHRHEDLRAAVAT
jgi:hypothetical protein